MLAYTSSVLEFEFCKCVRYCFLFNAERCIKPPTITVATIVYRHTADTVKGQSEMYFDNMRRAHVEPQKREQQEEPEVADFEEIELLRLQACSCQTSRKHVNVTLYSM